MVRSGRQRALFRRNRLGGAVDTQARAPAAVTVFVLYADDSGDEESSFFAGVMIPVDRWAGNLAKWLQYRAALYRQQHVPASFELHAVDWVTPARIVQPMMTLP